MQPPVLAMFLNDDAYPLRSPMWAARAQVTEQTRTSWCRGLSTWIVRAMSALTVRWQTSQVTSSLARPARSTVLAVCGRGSGADPGRPRARQHPRRRS
jgi:hypothetical protein